MLAPNCRQVWPDQSDCESSTLDPVNQPALVNTSRAIALWQLAAAVLLSSLTALFAKLIHLPVVEIIFWRSTVAACALLSFLVITRSPIRLAERREYFFFLGSGTLLAAHWLTYFHAIQLSTVAVGIIALYTYPIISIILEPFFDRQRHRVSDLLVGVIVFVGVALMAPKFELSNTTTKGIFWGVFSASIYSVRNLLIRRHVRHYPAPTVMLYQVTATVLVLLPVMSLRFQIYDERTAGKLVLLGVMFTAVHHTLFAAVLKQFTVKTASVIASIQPVIAGTFAWLILGEVPTWRVAIGGFVVIGAAVLETSRNVGK